MDGNAAHLFSQVLTLPGVKSGPDLDAESLHDFSDRHCTPNGAGGTIKRGEEPVPGRVLLFAPETRRLPPHQRVVGAQEIAPSRIAERNRPLTGSHDVEETHCRQEAVRDNRRTRPRRELFNLVENPLLYAPAPVLVAGQLHEPS